MARLEALLEEQAALRRVATLVARGTEARTLFDCVCEELGGVLGVESTDMIRFGEGDATVVGTWAKEGSPSFPVGSVIPVDGDTVTGKLRRTGTPQRVDDYDEVEGELAERLRAAGIRSAAGAPIEVAGRLWGGIMAVSDRAYALPPETEERISDFAELVTAALANADAREELAASRARILESADAARRRLERDLHDGAQQRLVSIALDLRMLESAIGPESEAAGELAAVRDRLQEALDELRELARGIHPSVLTDRGLRAAIEALAARSPVPAEVAVAVAPGLSPAVETTIYFVVAEALTNVARHARCEMVAIRVEVEEGWARAEVRDDGIGGAELRGSGLRGLADRVSALGGSLDVHSPPGEGTAVLARIPVERVRG